MTVRPAPVSVPVSRMAEPVTVRVPAPARLPAIDAQADQGALAVEREGAAREIGRGDVVGGAGGHGQAGVRGELEFARPADAGRGAQGRGAVAEAQPRALDDGDGAVAAEAAVAAADVEDAGLDRERAVGVEEERQARRAVGALDEAARVGERAEPRRVRSLVMRSSPAFSMREGASTAMSWGPGPQTAGGARLEGAGRGRRRCVRVPPCRCPPGGGHRRR